MKTIEFIKKGYGNAGRSGHGISLRSAEMIYDTRESVSRFLNFSNPSHVVFHHNATEALNVAIKASIPKGTHVLTSYMEHNSVLRPLYAMEKKGWITLSFFSHHGNIEKNIEDKILPNSTIVCSLVSNVTGEEIELSILSRIRKKYNAFLIVDASQMLCHKAINLSANEVDILCSAGHKGAFGMQGVAFSVYKNPPAETYLEGGSGIETFSHSMPDTMPERLEAGTLSAPAIASLKYGLDYVMEYGMDDVSRKLSCFDGYIDSELENIIGLRVLSKGNCGIHSFVIENEKSSVTARRLEEHQIMVRGGYHCAPLIHRFYETEQTGAVRVSLSILNRLNELKYFVKIMKKSKA